MMRMGPLAKTKLPSMDQGTVTKESPSLALRSILPTNAA